MNATESSSLLPESTLNAFSSLRPKELIQPSNDALEQPHILSSNCDPLRSFALEEYPPVDITSRLRNPYNLTASSHTGGPHSGAGDRAGKQYLQAQKARLVNEDEVSAKHLARTLAVNPAHKGALLNLAAIYMRQGRGTDALPLLKRAVEGRRFGDGSQRGWVSLISCMTQVGKHGEAGDLISRILESSPSAQNILNNQENADGSPVVPDHPLEPQ